MSTEMTRAEVAQRLEDFLRGQGAAWDWDDFISVRLKHPALESIRASCASLPESFPPKTPGRYCDAEGMAVLSALLALLRE